MLHLRHYNPLTQALVGCFTGSDHFWTIIFGYPCARGVLIMVIFCYVFGFKMGDPLRVSCSVFFLYGHHYVFVSGIIWVFLC